MPLSNPSMANWPLIAPILPSRNSPDLVGHVICTDSIHMVQRCGWWFSNGRIIYEGVVKKGHYYNPLAMKLYEGLVKKGHYYNPLAMKLYLSSALLHQFVHDVPSYLHIEAQTKWPPFPRQHFQMHFLEWKCMNFHYDFIEVCSLGSNLQYSSIDSDNGFAPARRQATVLTNDG